MARLDDLHKLIANYERRLQKREEQRSIFGINTPPEILTEIEDIEAELKSLRAEEQALREKQEEYQRPETVKGAIPDFLLRLRIAIAANRRKIMITVIIGLPACCMIARIGFPSIPSPTPTPTTFAASPMSTVGSMPTPKPTPAQPISTSLAQVEPKATILSHSDGDQVPFQTWIRGEAFNLPKDQQLWLLVQTELSNDYYPQPNPPTVGADGRWATIASFGHNNASSFAGRYTLRVVLAEPSVSKEFENFIKNWSKDQPQGMPLPKKGLVQLASVQLSRSIPDVRLLEPKAGSRVVQTEQLRGTYANLVPDLWQLYGVIAVSDQQFRPFGPAHFEANVPDGWWTLEVEFDWPAEPDQPAMFYMLAILANGAQHQQILERAAREGTLLTYEDLASYGDYIFDPQGEPLAKTSFQRLERIVFASDKPGNDDIFVIDADGSGLTRLTTDPALDTEPAWSPDGNQIVFATYREDPTEPLKLYLMNAADGSNQRRLMNDLDGAGRSPSWSPDGQWIVFHAEQDDNTDIYKVRVDGTELIRLTDHPAKDTQPVWSPDGQYILFLSERIENYGGQAEIYLMDASDGTKVKRLTGNEVTIKKSNENGVPVFGSLVTPVSGSPAAFELGHKDSASWSLDGTQILFISESQDTRDVYLMEFKPDVLSLDDPSQLLMQNVKRVADVDYDRHPSFAPEGERFVFDSSVNNRQLFLVTVAGEDKPIQIQTGLNKSFDPAWSPVDDRIAFVGRYDGDWEIYTMWSDGTGITRMMDNTSNEIQPRISPDGRQMVFASDITGNFDLWLADTQTPQPWNELARANSPDTDWQPAWSPSGKQLAFASNRTGHFDIYVINADGTGLLPLTNDSAENAWPTWLSAAEVVFASRRSGEGDIYRINLNGGEPIPLIQNPGFDWTPVVSPDSKILAFASTRDTKGTYQRELYALTLTSGEINRLTDDPDNYDGDPLWSGDGRSIFFTSDRNGESVWVMAVDGSNPRSLINDDSRDYFLGNP